MYDNLKMKHCNYNKKGLKTMEDMGKIFFLSINNK